MDPVHIHLILNHFPIVGTIIGIIMLLAGMALKNSGVQKSALVVLALMAVAAIPVFLTGEPAEEAVENIAGVNESLIEAHEETAEFAIWVMEVAGALALIALFASARNYFSGNILTKLTAVAGIAAAVAMVRTGYLGGQIRHTELAGQTTVQDAGAGGEAGAAAETGEQPQGSDE